MLNCGGGRYLSFLAAAGRGCRWYSVSLLARREMATSKVKRLVAETACFQPNTGNAMKTTPLVLAVMTLFALNVKAGTEERLAACRRQIDTLDQRNRGILTTIEKENEAHPFTEPNDSEV
jgi:hypothetical protein